MLLALESATSEVGVALADDHGVLAAATLRPGRRHVETLHPLIAAVSARAGVALGDLDALAVDVGPGLFTGLRVAIAAAKAIAFGLGVPVVPLRSTDVLLAAAGHAPAASALVDLRRGELAWAHRRGDAPVRGTWATLADELAALGGSRLLVGDGALRYGAQIAARCAAIGAPAPVVGGDAFAAPPVAALARLAVAAPPDAACDPFALEPVYLREPDVRINWVTRDDEARAAGGGA